MFLCDWLNRPTFEDRAQDDLRRPDLVDIPSYYSRSPSSGLWILELGDKFVGLIALDASSDSTSTETISTSAPPVKTRDGKVKYTKGTSSTATIRHFYVEELYRPAGIQHDLLTHAVRMAFSRDPKVQTIRASDTPLKPYVSEALRQARFQLEAKTEKPPTAPSVSVAESLKHRRIGPLGHQYPTSPEAIRIDTIQGGLRAEERSTKAVMEVRERRSEGSSYPSALCAVRIKNPPMWALSQRRSVRPDYWMSGTVRAFVHTVDQNSEAPSGQEGLRESGGPGRKSGQWPRYQPSQLFSIRWYNHTCEPAMASQLYASGGASGTTLLFCLLYPPASFLDASQQDTKHVRAFDWTGHVPGYQVSCGYWKGFDGARAAASGPLTVIIDSVDTLHSDIGSLAKTERFLSELVKFIRTRETTSRLVLHALAPSPVITAVTQTRFSSSIAHITAHPAALIKHVAAEYLTPPPPLSPPEKFWRVFIPIAERHYEAEKLVFGPGGAGSGGSDFVLEVLVRGADGPGRRRGVERVLEGWAADNQGGSPCELRELDDLKSLWLRKVVEESGPDPTQNLSFNLNLTPQQQQLRAQVPLPYAHEGTSAIKEDTAAILYDPDSADDIDDDDPDEDLDI
ncbi:hypothetical protein IEO21_00221 [Rhodonia placenta]|uniref:Elongator complex protein 5 n=1 Tax=Rhodonia placenta TaxID=104341 RepID=A0A8H7U976_9APHY|nr:hypothetical protein IEO21_00221 [Postia placenta]